MRVYSFIWFEKISQIDRANLSTGWPEVHIRIC